MAAPVGGSGSLAIQPAAFVGHLLLPALGATLLCALVPLRGLRGRYVLEPGPLEPERAPIFVPWRIGAQMTGLLAALDGLAPSLSLHGSGLTSLLAVATLIARDLSGEQRPWARVWAPAAAGAVAFATLVLWLLS